MNSVLYLVPVTLGSSEYRYVIPESVLDRIKTLRYFIVEDLRSARRFLRLVDPAFPIDDSIFYLLNEHSKESEYADMLNGLMNGNDTGLMSEAGLPGIADPGSPVIRLAHKKGFRVIPLSGPSSIILALIASGLNGQNFAFNGYLPVKRDQRSRRIREIESLAQKGQSQIFMETPYRNMALLDDILALCKPGTSLCIACDITLETEYIMTMSVREWQRSGIPDINKRPAVFIIA